METIQDPKAKKVVKTFVTIMCTLMGITTAAAIYMSIPLAKQAYKEGKEYRYAIKHLDPKAIPPKENPFMNDFLKWGGILYKDIDNDGDYESVLIRKNSDGKSVEILAEKGLEGKIKFPTLEDNALSPLDAPLPRQFGISEVDYIDLNNNGKFESVYNFSLDYKNVQKMKVEVKDGKYSLSNIE